MKYRDALEYMESLKALGSVPGTESIRRLCAALGNPQSSLSFVHIAGTNGKGSVLSYVSTILKCAGYLVGRFLSPAIFDEREEIQVDAVPISKQMTGRGMELIKDACDKIVEAGFPSPTLFEVKTALALWFFKEKKCDIVVLECGMGGTYDATNIIENTLVSVITSVSMDHMQFLGKTLGEIAAHKAGIMRESVPVVSVPQPGQAMEVIERKAEELHCPLYVADPKDARNVHSGLEKQRFDLGDQKRLEISLAGRYQIENAVLAVKVIQVLAGQGISVSESALRQGLAQSSWPGRFTVIGHKPLFIADGAHNEDGARALADSVRFYFPDRRIIYIMGVLRDKEADKIISLTHMYADQIITVTPPGNDRGMPAYELALLVAQVHDSVTAVDSLEEAVEMSYLMAGKDDVILAFGSLSYLGRLMEIVENPRHVPLEKMRTQSGKNAGDEAADDKKGKV